MTNSYRDVLSRVRSAFSLSNVHGADSSRLLDSLTQALEQVAALKSDLPLFGVELPNDYVAAESSRLGVKLGSVASVTSDLVGYLRGTIDFADPRWQQNMTPPPSIPSLIGVLLASLANPNLGWDEFSRRVALAEVETTAITAALVGYDPTRAGGVFTFGGTGTMLYGVKLGLEKAIPGAMANGVGDGAVVFASEASHYCRHNVAGWLGIGTKNIEVVPTSADNAIDVERLRERARIVLRKDKAIAAFIATLGSTDAFGLDDLETIVRLRDDLVREFRLPYRPHVHADAVAGWAWSVFTDYDWKINPLGFRPRTVTALAAIERRIRHLHLADSIGVDFHKTGYCPAIASLFLVKDRDDFDLLRRSPEMMPYPSQLADDNPAHFTLETSRGGAGVLAALANLRFFGIEGWRTLLGHVTEMSQLLRERLEAEGAAIVLNRDNFGPVTLFRVYSAGVDCGSMRERESRDPALASDLHRFNEFNRHVAAQLNREAMAGRGVMISTTECYRKTSYGEPLVALKSYMLSPFVEEETVNELVANIRDAKHIVGQAF